MTSDQRQFMRLINENYGIIYKIINSYCNTDEDKKDLQQTILEGAWRSYPGFRGDCKFSTWLHKIGVNKAIEELRNKRIQRAGLERFKERPVKEPPVMPANWPLLFSRAFKQLNPRYQDLLVLYCIKQVQVDRVAALVGMSANAVRVRVHDSIKRIRKLSAL